MARAREDALVTARSNARSLASCSSGGNVAKCSSTMAASCLAARSSLVLRFRIPCLFLTNPSLVETRSRVNGPTKGRFSCIAAHLPRATETPRYPRRPRHSEAQASSTGFQPVHRPIRAGRGVDRPLHSSAGLSATHRSGFPGSTALNNSRHPGNRDTGMDTWRASFPGALLAPWRSSNSNDTLAAPAQLQPRPQASQVLLDIGTATNGLDAPADAIE